MDINIIGIDSSNIKKLSLERKTIKNNRFSSDESKIILKLEIQVDSQEDGKILEYFKDLNQLRFKIIEKSNGL